MGVALPCTNCGRELYAQSYNKTEKGVFCHTTCEYEYEHPRAIDPIDGRTKHTLSRVRSYFQHKTDPTSNEQSLLKALRIMEDWITQVNSVMWIPVAPRNTFPNWMDVTKPISREDVENMFIKLNKTSD